MTSDPIPELRHRADTPCPDWCENPQLPNGCTLFGYADFDVLNRCHARRLYSGSGIELAIEQAETWASVAGPFEVHPPAVSITVEGCVTGLDAKQLRHLAARLVTAAEQLDSLTDLSNR